MIPALQGACSLSGPAISAVVVGGVKVRSGAMPRGGHIRGSCLGLLC